jgi:hypothetical protein
MNAMRTQSLSHKSGIKEVLCKAPLVTTAGVNLEKSPLPVSSILLRQAFMQIL